MVTKLSKDELILFFESRAQAEQLSRRFGLSDDVALQDTERLWDARGRTRGVRVIIRSSVSGLDVCEDEPLRLAEAGLRRRPGSR
jgi:hypothetical protein